MTLAESATRPPMVLAGASSIRTPSSALGRGCVPRIGTTQPGQADLGADLVVGDRVALRRRAEDVDAVALVARDQVARAGEPVAARLADVVVGREHEHAVAAVVEDEVRRDRVARPLRP